MKRNFTYFSGHLAAASLLISAFATSCGNDDFKIKGEIYGAENRSVVLAKSDFHGRWVAIDSARVSSSGAFSISRPAPAAPEIFRVEIDGRFIYVPIDSTETVTLTSSLDKFGTEFTLSGSQRRKLSNASRRRSWLSLPTQTPTLSIPSNATSTQNICATDKDQSSATIS